MFEENDMTSMPVFARSIFTGLTARGAIMLFALILLTVNASAQQQLSTTDGATPMGVAPGTPAGAYGLSGFDNVNLYNGNLNFNMPLLQIGGRGGAKTSINLTIDSTQWTTDTFLNEGERDVFGYSIGDLSAVVGGWGSDNTVLPSSTWWGGLRVGYGPGVLQGRRALEGNYPQRFGFARLTLTRLTFTASDGTEYELRDALLNVGMPHLTSSSTPSDGFNRGRVFVSADGTAMTFIVDASYGDIRDASPSDPSEYFFPSGVLLF